MDRTVRDGLVALAAMVVAFVWILVIGLVLGHLPWLAAFLGLGGGLLILLVGGLVIQALTARDYRNQ